MSDRNLLRYLPRARRRHGGRERRDRRRAPRPPGRRPAIRVRAALQATLPPDVRVLTLDEFIAKERDFWDKVAPIGTVFYIGVVMGFIVGCVICYQVLFADISDRLGEFATLKAMGYSNLRLFRVVVMQGVYLAVCWAIVAGLAVSLLLFNWVHEATGLPLDLSRNDPAADPGPVGRDVRRLRGLRGAEAAVGGPRAALRLSGRTIDERPP